MCSAHPWPLRSGRLQHPPPSGDIPKRLQTSFPGLGCASSPSCAGLFAAPRTIARQASLSMGSPQAFWHQDLGFVVDNFFTHGGTGWRWSRDHSIHYIYCALYFYYYYINSISDHQALDSGRLVNCLFENHSFTVLVVVAITKRGLQCPLEVMPSCKNKGAWKICQCLPRIWVSVCAEGGDSN